jgi:hypothetical protein
MTFSPTIDVGNLLTLLGMAVAVFWFAAKMSGDIRILATEVSALKLTVSKFGDAIITLARQDERLTASDVRSNTLRQNMDNINDRLTMLERSVRQQHNDATRSPHN